MRKLKNEREGHTLQATALVHEAHLRLTGKGIDWQDRTHCFAVAAQQMRRILVDHARTIRAQKWGAGARKVSLDDVLLISDCESAGLLDIDRSLERLAQWDSEKSANQRSGRLEKFSLTATQAILYFDSIAPGDTVTLRFRLRAKYPIRARTFASRAYEYYDPAVNSVARPVQLEVRQR